MPSRFSSSKPSGEEHAGRQAVEMNEAALIGTFLPDTQAGESESGRRLYKLEGGFAIDRDIDRHAGRVRTVKPGPGD